MKEQWVEVYLTSMKEKQHLLPLLPKEEWVLKIIIENSQWNISFSRNKIGMLEDKSYANSLLHCTLQDWVYVISGKQKLRQVLKMGEATYEGTFRSLLWVESILFLAACPVYVTHTV